MHDWTIEAHIDRLNKASGLASTAEERRKLEGSADARMRVLPAEQRARSVLAGS
jgi:hypothetical protein